MGLLTAEERLAMAFAMRDADGKCLNLDVWQGWFLKDTQRFSIVLKSRRTGFSFITALKGLIKANDGARKD